MQDLVVCVGESCHLNGAELVVTRFQEIIEQKRLAERVALKGSFCIGECRDDGNISVRWRDRILSVDPDRIAEAFEQEVLPGIDSCTEED